MAVEFDPSLGVWLLILGRIWRVLPAEFGSCLSIGLLGVERAWRISPANLGVLSDSVCNAPASSEAENLSNLGTTWSIGVLELSGTWRR